MQSSISQHSSLLSSAYRGLLSSFWSHWMAMSISWLCPVIQVQWPLSQHCCPGTKLLSHTRSLHAHEGKKPSPTIIPLAEIKKILFHDSLNNIDCITGTFFDFFSPHVIIGSSKVAYHVGILPYLLTLFPPQVLVRCHINGAVFPLPCSCGIFHPLRDCNRHHLFTICLDVIMLASLKWPNKVIYHMVWAFYFDFDCFWKETLSVILHGTKKSNRNPT